MTLATTPDQLARAASFAAAVVAQIREEDLGRPTPCTEWDVRALLNHLLATTTKFTDFALALTDAPVTPRGDLLGADPVGAFDTEVRRSVGAWTDADLGRTCRMPFGEFSAGEAAGINVFALLVHAWDLAQALGTQLPEPDPDLVAVAAAAADRLVTDEAVEQGMYAASDAGAGVPDLAAVVRRTGRDADGWRH